MSGNVTADNGTAVLRLVLLSARGLQETDTLERIDRLFHQEGGRGCAIVFLLATNDNHDGMGALGRLQIE